MTAGYDGYGLVAAGLATDLYIQFLGNSILERYEYTRSVDHSLATTHGIAVDIAEHFESQFGLAAYRSEGYSYGQTGHAGARNPYTHSVLDDIRAESGRDSLRFTSEHTRGLGHTESHGYRFGTSYGRHHLAFDQRYDAGTPFVVDHGEFMSMEL